MKYKFIDIGCGHQCVSSDVFGTGVVGMYVEPIWQYLDVLPTGQNIVKVHAAVANHDGDVSFNAVICDNVEYFTREQLLEISKNHQKLKEYNVKYGKSSESSLFEYAKLSGVSEKITVPSTKLRTLFDKYDVQEVEYLKIDVEGFEADLLKQLIPMMLSGRITITTELRFECNSLSDTYKLQHIADIICDQFGYTKRFVVTEPWNEDLILTKI